ncbi:lysoplasmalogenase family protein [Streptomyces sp. 8N114]|uniref:lysoplasmalogenase family protein n=1 Tax=Streptomyces sp. 8N114 TaxID=3457419 RepID=UPI003FD60966
MAITKGKTLGTFAALAAADLYATAKAPRGPARAAKPFLMPALAAHARRTAQPGRPPAALLAGLGCATAGDTALLWDRHHRALLTGMAAFLGTQVSYTAGMTAQLGAVRGLRTRPKRAAVAFAAWGAVNAVLAPTLERRLRLPVAGYSLALAAMGAAALGVGGKVATGALAFIASDALIGLQAAGYEFPSQEVLIMAGYLLGQYLITTGWLERVPSPAPA